MSRADKRHGASCSCAPSSVAFALRGGVQHAAASRQTAAIEARPASHSGETSTISEEPPREDARDGGACLSGGARAGSASRDLSVSWSEPCVKSHPKPLQRPDSAPASKARLPPLYRESASPGPEHVTMAKSAKLMEEDEAMV